MSSEKKLNSLLFYLTLTIEIKIFKCFFPFIYLIHPKTKQKLLYPHVFGKKLNSLLFYLTLTIENIIFKQ